MSLLQTGLVYFFGKFKGKSHGGHVSPEVQKMMRNHKEHQGEHRAAREAAHLQQMIEARPEPGWADELGFECEAKSAARLETGVYGVGAPAEVVF